MMWRVKLTCYIFIFCFFQIIQIKGRIVQLSKTRVVMRNPFISRIEETEPGFDLDEADIAKFHIWPMGVIPYYIDDFSFDKVLRDKIRSFLDRTNLATGLRFMEIPRPPESSKARWVLFINRQGYIGCADHSFKNFTNEGVQKIVLGYNCLNAGEELAEAVLSLVGVPPQHNAPNRDSYVKVDYKNILPEKAYLFEILKNDEWLFHNVPYDFASVGHFSPHEHTSNGRATVAPKVLLGSAEIKKSKTFSSTDIWKIRMIYNYISKQQAKNHEIPECEMIFSRGSNFSNYDPDTDDELKPRPKPEKYSGLEPEEKLKGEEIADVNEKNKVRSANDSLDEENDDKIESGNVVSLEIGSKEQSKNKSSITKLSKTKKAKLSKVMEFSDYRTDE